MMTRTTNTENFSLYRNPKPRPGKVAVAALALFAALFLTGNLSAQVDDLADTNVQEREAALRARKLGFGDLEVDNLHGSISKKLAQIIDYGGLRKEEGSYLSFMMGEDQDKKTFFRFRIREGNSYSVEERPVQYLFKAHCYLYLDVNEKKLTKIIFQFYRINFSGINYVRELRRMIHPEPLDLVGGDPLKEDLKTQDNSKLLLEQFEEPSTVKPDWEGPDGIPLPNLSLMPRQRIELNNPKDLIPYDKQVRIITRYKRLLRSIDRELQSIIRDHELDRRIRIEKIMDFPG